ncbi:MAG: hypothetical protein EOO10_09515 [Chitinophagaceae bacterium]|nr:MAG: hypothetical protein EOO10_09515 [Chitinophagaceae bacterium]
MESVLKYISVVAFFVQIQAAAMAQSTQAKDTIFVADGNPIIRHKFTADPAALVYKDKVDGG